MRHRFLLEGRKENLALINPILDAVQSRDSTVRRDDPAINIADAIREKIRGNWETTVDQATKALTKRDALEWYLRLSLQYAISSWNRGLDPTKMAALKQRYFNKVGVAIEEDEFEGATSLTRLVHYFSLPIEGIKSYQFHNQSFDAVMTDFRMLEEAWQAKANRLIDDSDDPATPVIDFGNGWFWVDLKKAFCDKESRAMGHCGNSPRDDSQDTILSLRKKVRYGETTRWEPALTFILTQDGMLTEMKGRQNDKPVARYHKMIIALLLNPIVKGIVGGGYKPENNFSLDDLAPEERDALIKQKPRLGSLEEMYLDEGLSPDVKIRIKVMLETFDSKISGFTDGEVILGKYDTIESFLKEAYVGGAQTIFNFAAGRLDKFYWFGKKTGYAALLSIIDNEDGTNNAVQDFLKKLSGLTGTSQGDAISALKYLFPDALENVFEHLKDSAQDNAQKALKDNIGSFDMVYLNSHCSVVDDQVLIKCPQDIFIQDLSNAMLGRIEGESPLLLTVLNDRGSWYKSRNSYKLIIEMIVNFLLEERQRYFALILDLFHTGVE